MIFWDLSCQMRVPAPPPFPKGLQSLVISCSMSTVSGHLLYYVCSPWSSPVLCLQSLVISCSMSAVSGNLLYYVRSLWSFPVLCLQSIG
ncbi:unnamed protein product [Staurois parvus]|uniref:Uncharacterized protein n=1 Tax=Staurois parvus TaxID=386267 RepID=A0ABN9EX96_9NEOB|nr:unnamed protein product [Staurois parvus]